MVKTWNEIGTVRVKCFEHDAMTLVMHQEIFDGDPYMTIETYNI